MPVTKAQLQAEVEALRHNNELLLPIQPVYQNVVEGMPEAVQRHDDLFAFTH